MKTRTQSIAFRSCQGLARRAYAEPISSQRQGRSSITPAPLPPFRLLAQIGGALLLYFGGWRLPFSSSAALAIVAQCLFVIVFVNAFNFLDGADGLAAGITAVVALRDGAMPGVGVRVLGFAVAWSLGGACVGFLVFNFPPAKIFMGDSGSTVLGFSAAFLGLDLMGARGGGVA